MAHILLEPLLQHVVQNPLGERLSSWSVQTKVEKFVLAEIAYGAAQVLPEYEFWLEERPHRDLTIRELLPDARGRLVEWIEAKMCYSDCVARRLWGGSRPEEYCVQLARDVDKQRAQAPSLSVADKNATLTAALFVFHRTEPHPRHKYYPRFENRGQRVPAAIKDEAVRFCREEIRKAAQRDISEEFKVRLGSSTELLGFCYSDEQVA